MAPVTVELVAPEQANLLGVMLQGLIARNLDRPALATRARRLRGDIAVQAGRMRITLRFTGEAVRILADPAGKPRARVSGDMTALLALAAGGPIVAPVLRRAVCIGGNPFFLLRALPLIRAPKESRA